MILTIGEILFDIFPDYRQMGGAPFNFAFHLSALGEPVAFVSRIGKDENGTTVLRTLREKHFPSQHIQVDPEHPTGHVLVSLDDKGSPAFSIVEDVAYDYLEYAAPIADILHQNTVRLIYFGTLIQRTPRGSAFIQQVIAGKSSKTKCIYDINLRPGCYDFQEVRRSLMACDILKINNDELAVLKKMLDEPRTDALFVRHLMASFAIEWVCLTLGGAGSILFTPDDVREAAPPQAEKMIDTVGAGDAYAAMLAKGWLEGWPPEIIVDRATRFAGAVCGIKGAVPDDPLFYRPFTDEFIREVSK